MNECSKVLGFFVMSLCWRSDWYRLFLNGSEPSGLISISNRFIKFRTVLNRNPTELNGMKRFYMLWNWTERFWTDLNSFELNWTDWFGTGLKLTWDGSEPILNFRSNFEPNQTVLNRFGLVQLVRNRLITLSVVPVAVLNLDSQPKWNCVEFFFVEFWGKCTKHDKLTSSNLFKTV